MRYVTLLCLIAISAIAQRTPVILVDGYHLLCDSGNLSSTHDFGELQARLEAEGVQVTFFGSCMFPAKPSIEDLGNSLGGAIRKLNVPHVDVVSHSMGGLVVRSYLAGKQNVSGLFVPPPDTRIRKWISIATPNFGALLPSIASTYLPDTEAREQVPASQFLFELATWNQNQDDLRGVDAIALVGNAGGFGPFEGASDGTVAVTSASLSFAEPDDRTRVVPYCHGSGDFTSILGLGCDAPPLAKIQSDNPLSWQLIDSFLSGTDAWRTVGHSPREDRILSKYGGVLKQSRTSADTPTGSIQDQNFLPDPPAPGTYVVVIDKAGPQIGLIAPSAARLASLSLAPRMLISIYGSNLSGSTVSVNGQTLALNYSSDRQINTLLPDSVSGLAKLTVTSGQGQQTTNIFVESAVPAVFTANGSGAGAAAAIRNGDFLSLYLTGLGNGSRSPVVLVNGVPVPVTYAGAAPGFPGLDQINIQLAQGTSGNITVVAGGRASNTVTVP